MFGCRCYLLNDYKDVGKLKAKGDIGVFVGYSKESAAFRIYNKRTRKIHESVNVNFDEILKMTSKQFSLEPGLSNLNKTEKSSKPSVLQVSKTSKKDLEDLFHNFYDEYFDASKIMKSSTTNVDSSNVEVLRMKKKFFIREVGVPLSNTQSISNNMISNSDEASTSHNVFNERLKDVYFDESTSFHDPSNVHTFYQPYPHEKKWTKDHPLYKIISDPKSSARKRGQLANLCLFSCLLSSIEPANVAEALRDADCVSIDYDETFASVARIKAIRLFLAYATHKDFTVFQMDVKTTFLNGILKEEVYIGQPPGFVSKQYPDHVYALDKALYGLKQAPRFSDLMVKCFEMSMMGEMKFFLGLQVNQFSNGIFINQSKYILDILKRFEMENCDTVPTPMVEQAKFKLDLVKKPVDHTDYQSMIGSLMYVTSSRPDIMFATCMCARYQANPNEHHVSAVKRIFPYLKGTINLGLWYPKDSGFDLTAYSDADHARCHLDQKSTSSSVQFLCDKLVCWSSKKQNCMSISTAESEYVAVSSCCAQVLWMRTQLTDYGFFYDKVPIYCDSKSAIAISCNRQQKFLSTFTGMKAIIFVGLGKLMDYVGAYFSVLSGIGSLVIMILIESILLRVIIIFVIKSLSKAYREARIYNKRTRKIHESVNVNFDEISEMASKQFSLEPGLSNLNETGKSLNLSVSQIMKSSTTNVETLINGEVFHEVSESFQGESSSSSLNDDVQQSPEEVIPPQTNTQSISINMIPNGDEASTSHNVFNKLLEDAYFDASTSFHDPSNVHTYYQPYPHEKKWTKDHPLHKIIGDPKSSVRTRGQLANLCLFSCLLSSIEPANVAEALKDVDWVSAMQEELDQFARLKVWRLVPRPEGKSVIKTKWIFKNKKDESSLVIRNKARLVAVGYSQQEGIDYDETFAPVARIEAIRLFLAYATHKDFTIFQMIDFTVYQMDVKTAFLNGILKEEVYVGQPPGFVSKQYPDHVYALDKALYGLKQAPRAWYDVLSQFLIDSGFQKGSIDTTLFIKKKDEYDGRNEIFLGLQVNQFSNGIFINQSKYILDILKRFEMENCDTVPTPMVEQAKLKLDLVRKPVDQTDYPNMIRSLMYVIPSRPDIMFATCICARY
nr:putative reverse transcriptase, RNA-dependent DNA polymerase [Tanacetum cinerariifolium]